jgi:hypothetical protein
LSTCILLMVLWRLTLGASDMAGKRYQAGPDDDFRNSVLDNDHFSPLQMVGSAAGTGDTVSHAA